MKTTNLITIPNTEQSWLALVLAIPCYLIVLIGTSPVNGVTQESHDALNVALAAFTARFHVGEKELRVTLQQGSGITRFGLLIQTHQKAIQTRSEVRQR